MALDPQAQRRRAAVAVLSSVLDENALLQALWLLQDSMRGDQVSDIIRYVDALARQHLLDAPTCKRLYNEFYRALRTPEDQLPMDPWPAMQPLRPAPAVAVPQAAPAPAYWNAPPVAAPAPVQAYAPAYAPAFAPAFAPAPAPAYVPPPAYAAAQAQPVSQAAAMAPIAPVAAALAELPAAAAAEPVLAAEPPVVFGAVMRAVIAEVHAFHREALDEVQRDALRVLGASRASAALQQRFRDAWARARQHDWQLQGPHGDLAELTRVVFVALTEAFGRVGADQILQRAVTAAEALPEARQFSPKRLMAAM